MVDLFGLLCSFIVLTLLSSKVRSQSWLKSTDLKASLLPLPPLQAALQPTSSFILCAVTDLMSLLLALFHALFWTLGGSLLLPVHWTDQHVTFNTLKSMRGTTFHTSNYHKYLQVNYSASCYKQHWNSRSTLFKLKVTEELWKKKSIMCLIFKFQKFKRWVKWWWFQTHYCRLQFWLMWLTNSK